MSTTTWYRFCQNNSGGFTEIDQNLGDEVLIEVTTRKERDMIEEAEKSAEDLGIYFNGVEQGSDCPCCGDRWSPDPDKLNMDIDTYIRVVSDPDYGYFVGRHIVAHHLDGTRKRWYLHSFKRGAKTRSVTFTENNGETEVIIEKEVIIVKEL